MTTNINTSFNTFGYNQVNDYKKYLCHGTTIVAAICNDGILFASDSRSSFLLNEEHLKKAYSYFDNSKKIFRIGKYLIAFSGISMLNKKFMRDIVGEYNEKYPEQDDIESTLNKFILYLYKEHNVPESLILENQIIIAGYENFNPKIVAQQKGDKMYQNNIGYMIHSDTELPKFLNLNRNIELTCKNLMPYMENGIYTSATHIGNNEVGGPLEFIQISPTNEHITLKTFKEHNFKNYEEMSNAIINNEIEVKYLFPFSEELLKKTLKEGVELGY